MWSCPRSRSTLITRAFEQLDGCVIYDEPLYAPYLLNHGFDHPERELVIAERENDYHKVIKQITGDLPKGTYFSFQKQMAKHIKPDDDAVWLKSFDNFFLIRNPKEIILSYSKVCPKVTKHDVGIEELYDTYKKVEKFTGKKPLIIDSTDLIKNPRNFLSFLCAELGLNFSEKMLNWSTDLQSQNKIFNNPFPMLWTENLPPTSWYSNIIESTGFKPYQESKKEVDLPKNLSSVLEECLPFYEKLVQNRLIID
jgi:hypothetical protein